jgi:formate hydrogenlyase subunit 3/multisubunit Na+/H+ antiporter MnhD subunit
VSDRLLPPWIVAPVMVPLLASLIAVLAGRRVLIGLLIAVAATLGLSLTGLTAQVRLDGPQPHAIGGWGAPLGIDLYADGLSLVFLWLTFSIAVPVGAYALGYFERASPQARAFQPAFYLLWTALNALFLAADVFNLYVTLELLTLAAIALIALATLPAALRYLWFALVASAAYLLGITLLYGGYGTLDIAQLGGLLQPEPAAWLALSLITLSMLVKTAIFPLHGWLPPAHAEAPAPVSALLSAVVVKASFYLLLRLWFEVFPPAITFAAGQLLGILGALAILYGSLQAIVQPRLKLLVAYSTVAQLGYLLLVFPLGVETAWNGAVLHAVSHGFAKAALFLAAGNLLHALGRDRLDELGGLPRPLLFNLFVIGIAGVSIMGLPPSSAFLAKWLLLQAALDARQWWWIPVILAGGLLAAVYVFRVFSRAFAPPTVMLAPVHSLSFTLQIVPLLLALAGLLLGLAAAPILELLQIGSPFARPESPP